MAERRVEYGGYIDAESITLEYRGENGVITDFVNRQNQINYQKKKNCSRTNGLERFKIYKGKRWHYLNHYQDYQECGLKTWLLI